jgi:hypothetical protein
MHFVTSHNAKHAASGGPAGLAVNRKHFAFLMPHHSSTDVHS